MIRHDTKLIFRCFSFKEEQSLKKGTGDFMRGRKRETKRKIRRKHTVRKGKRKGQSKRKETNK
jgi:hypothetical protein